MNRRQFVQASIRASVGVYLTSTFNSVEARASRSLTEFLVTKCSRRIQAVTAFGVWSEHFYLYSPRDRAVFVVKENLVTERWDVSFVKKLSALTVSSNGKNESLYISDSASHTISRIRSPGRIEFQLGRAKSTTEMFRKFLLTCPTAIAVSTDRELYVCESAYGQRVHRFTNNGDYIQTIACQEMRPKSIPVPTNICLAGTNHNELFVSDYLNRRVNVFTLDGLLRHSISLGSIFPRLMIGRKRTIIVIGSSNEMVGIDPVGHNTYEFAAATIPERGRKKLCSLDAGGNLYAVDGYGRISKTTTMCCV